MRIGIESFYYSNNYIIGNVLTMTDDTVDKRQSDCFNINVHEQTTKTKIVPKTSMALSKVR